MAVLVVRAAGQELARRTRKAQGFPPKIRDKDAVRKIVALLVSNGRGAKP